MAVRQSRRGGDGKPHAPTKQTREDVRALSAFGIEREQIARYIGVSPTTLRKWYPEELETGSTRANVAVGKFLLHSATGRAMTDGATHADCLRAAMFWAKTRMRWRETDRDEGTAEDLAKALREFAQKAPV